MNWKIVAALTATFLSGVIAGIFCIHRQVKEALKNTIGDLVNEVVDSVYPCKLIATIRYNQESDQSIVDMSQYDKTGIAAVTIDKIGPPANEQEESLDNTPTLYKNAVVYNIGGHWFWKIL